jgi:hypothetical protein
VQELLEKGEAVGKITTFLKSAGTDGKLAKIPNTDAGKEVCLAWHMKGGCYNNCQRLKSNPTVHGALKDNEVVALCAFIDAGLDKIANSEKLVEKTGQPQTSETS